MKIFVKQLICTLLLGGMLTSTSNAWVVPIKKITSLKEAKAAADDMFAAFKEIIATHGKVHAVSLREKHTKAFYYEGAIGYSYEAWYTLSYTMEAVLDYFGKAMLKAKPERVARLHNTFTTWRAAALQQADDLLAHADETARQAREQGRLNDEYQVRTVAEYLRKIRRHLDKLVSGLEAIPR